MSVDGSRHEEARPKTTGRGAVGLTLALASALGVCLSLGLLVLMGITAAALCLAATIGVSYGVILAILRGRAAAQREETRSTRATRHLTR